MEQFLTVKEVIQKTHISRSALYKKIQSGEFPAPLKVGERSVRFRESEVTELMDTRQKTHSPV